MKAVDPADLQFITAVNRRTELERVATMIHQLVATKRVTATGTFGVEPALG